MSSAEENSCEEELREIQQRFEKEGLDWDGLGTGERHLHLWRWLQDAESNLRSSRRMLDKLREVQHEELEEMEGYVSHVRQLADTRAAHLESEVMTLRSRLEVQQSQAATLANLLQRSGLESTTLPDDAAPGDDNWVGEQVALLIADRAKLIEEIEVLRRLKFSDGINGMNKEGELLSEVIKVSSEKEVMKREVTEMCERVQLLEKASRQLELDNERLAFKLSEALAELEERETQLRQLGPFGRKNSAWPRHKRLTSADDLLSSCSPSPTEEGGEEEKALPSSKDPIVVENSKEDAPKENVLKEKEPSPKESPKLSVLVAESPMLSRFRKLEISTDPKSELGLTGCVPSPRRYAALLERNDMTRLEELQKLQSEQEKLKGQVTLLSDKYNSLAMRHIQYKSKRKAQVEDLRARLDVELSSLQSEVDALQARLAMQKKTHRGEESFRRRVEADYRRMQDDKRKLVVNMMASENTSRDKEQEVGLLNKKIALLERANSELLSRVLDLKYAARQSANSPNNKTPSPSEDIKMLEISSAV